jgi:hypothetical protein
MIKTVNWEEGKFLNFIKAICEKLTSYSMVKS